MQGCMRMVEELRYIFKQIKKLNISAFASSTAFFLFLSLVPMVLTVCTILPFTPLTEQNLLNAVRELMPDTVDDLMVGIINEVYDKSAGILSVAVLITLWSAGKGVLALMRGLNAINEVEENRNYFVVRLVASGYTLMILLMLLMSLLIMVFGNSLVNILLYRIPRLQELASLLMNFRFIVVWVVLTLFFCVIYTYIPGKKLLFREQLPGAMFAAIVWSVFSWAFSLYVGYNSLGSVYGSLSIVIIVMLWLYFCMYIVLVGAYLNQWFRKKNRMS